MFLQLRYQKNSLLGSSVPRNRWLMHVGLISSVFLVGCAGAAKAPEVEAHQAPKQMAALAPTYAAPPPAVRWNQLPSVPATARQAVIDARAALQAKNWRRLVELVQPAKADPVLGAYPAYWHLRQQIHDSTRPIPSDQLWQFLREYDDEYLAQRLKGDWAIAAVRAGDFQLINQLQPQDLGNSQVRCAVAYGRHMTQQSLDIQRVLSQFVPGSTCWSLLDQLWEAKAVGFTDVRDLMRAALEQGKTSEARRYAAIIFDGKQMQDYTALMEAPRRWLDQQGQVQGQAHTELVSLALSRLARQSDRAAQAQYIEQKWAAQLPQANKDWVWGQFGLIPALRVENDAARWYRLSGTTPKTDYNHAWEVRAELRQYPIDWKQVERAIAKMSEPQASEPVWVYWKARALAAQGHQAQAQAAYESISSDLSFYGQLANEELGRAIPLPPQPTPISVAEKRDVATRPAFLRSLELFKLGWRPEATTEWAFALRGMNDRQLRAAAELARDNHVYDRVVNTSLLTKQEVDFSQRFVAPFEGGVTEKARLIGLDPAWVYGLIRQESRFMMDARSGVGASGLMQLMPATAKWTANKIGMTHFTPSMVNEFETNTILGTNYLNMVLGQLGGSEVLASAGYNAGPKRPINWRSRLQGPVEGAIFAETIPFTETRLYVKNVLSNATYYSMMFSGQPQSLKQRLGTISPQSSRTTELP
ncbi:transglycosylase SLT domain-containing protein [Paenalcaligenes hominis]|uniref:lytic transglycosylase domain-containing protein n=1 Tax=Paenalcaligenes hominis TaxID=643674 RepID=UPI0014316284